MCTLHKDFPTAVYLLISMPNIFLTPIYIINSIPKHINHID